MANRGLLLNNVLGGGGEQSCMEFVWLIILNCMNFSDGDL